MNESFKIKLCQEKKNTKKKIKHTHAPPKKLTKQFLNVHTKENKYLENCEQKCETKRDKTNTHILYISHQETKPIHIKMQSYLNLG
jgi:hypothetical protein